MKVMCKNPRTGELKAIKVGFSWVLFFSALFGLPLFLRKLYGLGAFMAAWRVFVILMNILPGEAARAGLLPLPFMVDTGLGRRARQTAERGARRRPAGLQVK